MHIVWFKRDVRIYDHEALTQAAKHGPVLPIYILEPDLWHQPDMSYRHYLFLQDCLSELEFREFKSEYKVGCSGCVGKIARMSFY